jgi:ATP-binding cassette subfamily B protein
MSRSRAEALLRAMAGLQQGAAETAVAATATDPSCGCLAWAMAALDDPRVIQPLAGSFSDLLESNDVTHREVRTPRDLTRSDSQMLVVFAQDDGRPLAVQRRGGRTQIYDSRNGRLRPLRTQEALKPYAYELYAALPSPLHSPLQLFRFSFGSTLSVLATVLFSAVVVAVFNLSIPLLTGYLVGTVLPQGELRLIAETSLVVLLITISAMASQAFSSLATVRLESLLNLRLEAALWSHLLRLPLSFFQTLGAADLIERVSAISRMRQLLSSGLLITALGLLFSLSNLALMVLYQARLALVVSLFSLISAGVMVILVLRSAQLEKPLQEGQARLTDLSLQAVVGMPQIRVSGSERRMLPLANLMRRGAANSDALAILSRSLNPLGQALIFLTLVLMLDDVTRQGSPVSGHAEGLVAAAPLQLVATFVSFQAAYLSFNSQLSGMAVQVANSLARLLVLWQRSQVVMVASPEQGYQGALRPEPGSLRGELQITHLCVRYPAVTTPVLKGINLRIPAGRYTAITGPSGSGKTTLLRCILRLIEPEAGSIRLDGFDLRELAVRAYRRQLGVVLQNTPLPTGSIFDIVSAGRSVSREEVWQALEQAAVADDVLAMPMQLETLLSEGSLAVSGGQRQRLGLARALLGQPRILLLDEATSALDAPTQAAIMRTLESLPITRIAVAHRLSTLASADQIAVLRDGVISELGTFDALLAAQGGYLSRRQD